MEKPGGNYEAVQNPDRTWDVLDVPVMGTVPVGQRDNEEEIAGAWMTDAVQASTKRLRDSYLAPMHIKHHDFGVEPKRAGFFLPKRVGRMTYEGNEIDATFVDFKGIPEDVFAIMDTGGLPYCSVEIHDWDHREINSLALLETETPFFRFPLITIGKKKPIEEETVAMAAVAVGDKKIFFRLGEPMPIAAEEKLQAQTPDYDKAGDDGYFKEGECPESNKEENPIKLADEEETPSTEDDGPPSPPEDEGTPEEVESEVEEGMTGPEGEALPEDEMAMEAAHYGQEEQGLQVIGEALMLLTQMQAQATETLGQISEQQGMMVELLGGGAGAPPPSAAESPPPVEPTTMSDAKKAGEHVKLKLDHKKLVTKMRRTKVVNTLVAKLNEAGYEIDNETREEIKVMVDAGKEAVQAFMSNFKRTAIKDPSPSVEEATGDHSDPPEILKFADRGPKFQEMARGMAAQHSELKARGHINMSLEKFLEANMPKEA